MEEVAFGTMVFDEIVYARTKGAINATTGETIWEYADFHTVFSDDVFYMWNDGHVQAIDAYSGEQLWVHEAGIDVTNVHTITVAEGRVFVTFDRERLYALDAGTGELLWRSSLFEGIISPSYVVDNGVVVFGVYLPYPHGGGEEHNVGLDASTGKLLWRKKDGARRMV